MAPGRTHPHAISSLLDTWKINSPDLPITETIDEVIIHHSHGLHVGINDRRTDKTESTTLEVLAECIGLP